MWHRPNRPFPPYYWWGVATGAAIGGWLHHHWDHPLYHDYGDDGDVHYRETIVYVDGQRYATADEYYQQASDIAGAASGQG